MLDFIVDHYLIIMVVAAFFIFALIGYIVDNLKNKKREEKVEQILEVKDDIPEEIDEPILEENLVSEEEISEENLENEEENPENEEENPENVIPEVEEIQDNK
ncbi:MAG: hypothetical protein PHX04_00435 [Bacilli bacterium]|nr:hypothetical protein [Bacilli bacterium]